jgi:hypothetical protein
MPPRYGAPRIRFVETQLDAQESLLLAVRDPACRRRSQERPEALALSWRIVLGAGQMPSGAPEIEPHGTVGQ